MVIRCRLQRWAGTARAPRRSSTWATTILQQQHQTDCTPRSKQTHPVCISSCTQAAEVGGWVGVNWVPDPERGATELMLGSLQQAWCSPRNKKGRPSTVSWCPVRWTKEEKSAARHRFSMHRYEARGPRNIHNRTVRDCADTARLLGWVSRPSLHWADATQTRPPQQTARQCGLAAPLHSQ